MQYTAPHYYKKFHCIAGACPDTCCAGWQIQIDPTSLKKYKKAKGTLGNRLKNEIDWKESSFRQYDGRCAFLNDEDLCDLYLEGGGERAFCRTCRTYPRHIEEFEGLREISLSLSCPAAAELILNCSEPVTYLHAENPDRKESYEEFDFFLFTKLTDARSLILKILQDRTLPVTLRTAVVLSLSHDLQERIDKNALYDADTVLERYSSENVLEWHKKRPETPLCFFWDRKGEHTVKQVDETLSFHPLDDKKFLEMMSGCRAYASTAGFESICEAMYLGKPILMVPAHIEQDCNAYDAARNGAGIVSKDFNLDGLLNFAQTYRTNVTFRPWVNSAPYKILHELAQEAHATCLRRSLQSYYYYFLMKKVYLKNLLVGRH